jgi:Pentapeptide repeats (8 copies)
MANEEHLARLKQEVSAWDAWRLENPTIQPDLRAADLRGAHLIGANLTAAHLAEAQSASQHPGSVPFSVNADGGFLSVASPERRHRGPCENQQTTEEGRRQAWALRRGD